MMRKKPLQTRSIHLMTFTQRWANSNGEGTRKSIKKKKGHCKGDREN